MKTTNKTSGSRPTLAERALHRAGKTAKEFVCAHGTPIDIWQHGKVVAQKP